MKLVAGIIITLAAIAGHAQTNTCDMIKLEKEARHFIVVQGAFETRDIQPCLEIAIQKQLVADKVTERNFKNEKLAVLGIIAAIKQAKMAAIVKCESTGTPGCGSLEDENELDLDADADAKRSDVEQQRANGSRDW